MNKVVKCIYFIKDKNKAVQKELVTTIHKTIINNNKRLISHCSSIGRKTYGNNCELVRIKYMNHKTIYELCGE